MNDDDVPRGYYRATNGKLFKLQPGQRPPPTTAATVAPATSAAFNRQPAVSQIWTQLKYSHSLARCRRVESLGHALLRSRALQNDLHAVQAQPFAHEQTCFDFTSSSSSSSSSASSSSSRRFVIGSQMSAVIVSATRLCAHLNCVPNQFGPIAGAHWHPTASVVLIAQFGHHQPGRAAVFREPRDADVLVAPDETFHPRRNGSVWFATWSPTRDNCFVVGGTRGAQYAVVGGHARSSRALLSDNSDVFCAQFCANGNVVYFGARDGNVRLFDLRTGPHATRAGSTAALMQQRSSVSSIVVENDFELLVSSHFGTVQRWDLRTCRATPESFTVPGHNPIVALEMCATSDIHRKQHARIPLIATGSSQGGVQLWPLRGVRANSQPLRSFPISSSRVLCLRFDDDVPSGKLASLWSLSTGAGLIKSAV